MKQIYYIPANGAWYENDGEIANGGNFKGQSWKDEWADEYEVIESPAFNVFPY